MTHCTMGQSPPQTATAAPPARLALPKAGVRSLLAATEQVMRPTGRDDLIGLAVELQTRGLDEASRRLREQLTTADADFERLIARLLANRATAAAQAVLHEWQRRSPRAKVRQQFWSAAAHFSNGEFELAARDLDRVDEKALSELQVAQRGLRRLVDAERRGLRVGVERNPWQASFVDVAGRLQPGHMPAQELKKLDVDAADQVAAVLALVPMQGNLWGLMGELLNAGGDVSGAVAAFRRAEALAYTPRMLLEHRKLLDDYARAQEARASGLTGGEPKKSSNTAAPAGQPLSLEQEGLPKTKTTAVIAIGALIVLIIAALQIREWLRAASARLGG